jgi:hypothetical protein
MTITNGEFVDDPERRVGTRRDGCGEARSGARDQPTAYDAILLASFGGPRSGDDVIHFAKRHPRAQNPPTNVSKGPHTTIAPSGGIESDQPAEP